MLIAFCSELFLDVRRYEGPNAEQEETKQSKPDEKILDKVKDLLKNGIPAVEHALARADRPWLRPTNEH